MRYSVDLNYNCNNNCLFCFNLYDKSRSYKVADIKKQIAKVKKQGVTNLDFYGGEPLLYKKDLLAVLSYAKKLGLQSSLATNATLINKKLVEQFNELGVVSIRTTLHGPNKFIHDLTTKRKGSFAQTLAGIKDFLRYFKGEIIVNFVVTKLNIRHLPQMVELINKLDPHNKVIIKFSNLIYNGQANIYQKLALKFYLVQPVLFQLFKDLVNQKRAFLIEKFPYCVFRPFAKSYVKEEDLDKEIIAWQPECLNCQYKDNGCVGFNTNYLNYIQKDKAEITILNAFKYE
jgi:sulfatase maturation enzyme AslB (radical SAM superfamily)